MIKIDRVQMQKKYKEKQKREKKYNPTDFDELDIFLWFVVFSSVAAMIGLLIIGSVFHEDDRNKCEKVGGEYIVVDRTFTGKTAVDIYGCVK